MFIRFCCAKPYRYFIFRSYAAKSKVPHLDKYSGYSCTFIKCSTFGIFTGVCFSKFKFDKPLIAKCEQNLQIRVQNTLHSIQKGTGKCDYLWKLIIPDYLLLIGAVLTAFVAALMNVYIPLYLGDLVNVIACSNVGNGGFLEVGVPTFRLCSCYLVQSLCTFLYIGILGSVGERIAARLYCNLFRKMIYQDVMYFDVHKIGKLIDNISTDVQSFKSAFKQCVSLGLRNSTQVIGSVCSLLLISPTLTATIVGCLPLVFLIGTLMGTELRRLSRESQSQHSKSLSVSEEAFSCIHTVKSLTLEDYLLRNYENQIDVAKTLSTRLAYGIGIFQALSNLAINGIVLGVIYVGGHLVYNGQLNSGNLVSFLASTQTLQRSLTQVSLLYGQLVRGATAFNRIFETLNLSDGISDSISPVLPDALAKAFVSPPEIQFRNIQFAYPSRPGTLVFNDLNMNLPPGKVIALVGKSGAGKSTILSLLERFYDPIKGFIQLSGHDIKDFNVKALRSRIGYVSQEPQIFNATIRENIRFGLPEATDEQVEEAAKLAHAHDFIIRDMPQGYDTKIGQGSGTISCLSGGQRQRIAIARVFLKNAHLLLMDEATSALDAESEAKIQAALDVAVKGRTVVIIAHRLSTIKRADLILFMSGGQIVEQGTHSQLMAKRGQYYDLLRKQEGTEFLD